MPIINSKIGKNVKIWNEDLVNIYNSEIGDNTKIGNFVEIGNCKIGAGCNISAFCFLCEGVVLSDNVFLGPRVTTTNVKNPRAFIEKKNEFQETYIGTGATIGANATILCGIFIREYAMVGAGSVVTKDVMPYGLVAGNPARRIGKVDTNGGAIYDDII